MFKRSRAAENPNWAATQQAVTDACRASKEFRDQAGPGLTFAHAFHGPTSERSPGHSLFKERASLYVPVTRDLGSKVVRLADLGDFFGIDVSSDVAALIRRPNAAVAVGFGTKDAWSSSMSRSVLKFAVAPLSVVPQTDEPRTVDIWAYQVRRGCGKAVSDINRDRAVEFQLGQPQFLELGQEDQVFVQGVAEAIQATVKAQIPPRVNVWSGPK